MYSKESLARDDVKHVVMATEAEAQRNNWNVVIAVVDDGGQILVQGLGRSLSVYRAV